MASGQPTTSEPKRRFFVIPLDDNADLAELIAQHPNSWLLDSSTGVMTSLSGFKPKGSAAKPAAA